MRGSHAYAGEARSERPSATFAPLHASPGTSRQLAGQTLHIDRLMGAVATQVRSAPFILKSDVP